MYIKTELGGEAIFNFDAYCEVCKKEIEKIKTYLSSFKKGDVYGTRFVKGRDEGKQVKAIVIRPDFNSEGVITNYHIGLED